jgi:UDPglucose--hexose-1-phosphate uridylyltransferase
LRGEWVVYASHRQTRTFLPPPEYDPLAGTTDPAHPTEVPDAPWDVAVFENLFPALSPASREAPVTLVDTRPGNGACEVVVFTRDASTSLGRLPIDHIELLLEVWAERTVELGARQDVAYVFPFENRGVEIGVTLHHPHGQIYAYPFVPPSAAQELQQQSRWLATRGKGLLAELIDGELEDGRRLIWVAEHALVFVPVCARWAYELWVAPRRAVPTLGELEGRERHELARALKRALSTLDGLWKRPMPYVLTLHQAPTDGAAHPEAHAHFQIYPAYRMPGRLKYLAGSEIGAGVFTSDTLPEEKAAELRAVEVDLG